MGFEEIVRGVLAGERRYIARAITLVEEDSEEGRKLLASLPKTGRRSLVVGVTGQVGSGKSTLLGRVARRLSEMGYTVGVLAVDPTSPFTGGAVLGDRLRMLDASISERIFMRSMASRGGVGGLAEATEAAVKILETAGRDFILIETVGAGQTDVEVSRIADLVILVTMPESGDEIQGLKAGILEIADIVVVNKADMLGADTMVKTLRDMLPHGVEVVKTSSLTGEGIGELVEMILQRRKIRGEHSLRKRKRVEDALTSEITKQILPKIIERLREDEMFEQSIQKILEREITVKEAAQQLINRLNLT